MKIGDLEPMSTNQRDGEWWQERNYLFFFILLAELLCSHGGMQGNGNIELDRICGVLEHEKRLEMHVEVDEQRREIFKKITEHCLYG